MYKNDNILMVYQISNSNTEGRAYNKDNLRHKASLVYVTKYVVLKPYNLFLQYQPPTW